MKAMILAAGLGTRLEPLTKIRPKPLFPVLNRPLLEFVIEQLKGMGAQEIVINAHHLASQVVDFVHRGSWGDLKVEVRVEPEILGTGGGIKSCEDFLRHAPSFLVVNADVYHTFDLHPALHYHRETNNLATLVLYDHPRFNQVGVNAGGRIVSIRERQLQRPFSPPSILTFTGIHIISPVLLEQIPPAGYFDIIGLYIDLASCGEAIRGYQVHGGYWRDIGQVGDYRALHRDLLKGYGKPVVHSTAQVEEDVKMEGFVCVGRRTSIRAGSVIRDSILWDDAVVEGGSLLEGCIVGDGVRVRGEHRGEILTPGV